MILADRDIKERINKDLGITPFDVACVQPSSYDLHLLDEVLVFDNYQVAEIDVKKRSSVTRKVKIEEAGFVLHPGEFVLGSTIECLTIPKGLAGILEGKSSLGRIGLVVHATAGFVDPGYEGQLTFDMFNISRLPIRIYGGMKIAQLVFVETSKEVENGYGEGKLGSKYKGQVGPTESKGYLNFGGDES